MTLTFGSLFVGIGGLDLGFERSGMQCKWQVEIDEFCQKVLTKHWPDVPKYRDIRECGDNLEPVDVICGGFPCQPFSVAGKRRGKKDDRYLWPEMLRVIKAVRPTWVIGENVPGIIRMALDRVLSDLEAIGYTTRSLVIPACAVNAPHQRSRVFVVAHTKEQPDRKPEPKESNRPTPKLRGRGCQGTMDDTQNSNRGGQNDPFVKRRRITETRRPGYWDESDLLVGADGKVRRIKPGIQLLVDGIPGRLAQLKGYGNAVVPQVAEFIGRRIMEFDAQQQKDTQHIIS